MATASACHLPDRNQGFPKDYFGNDHIYALLLTLSGKHKPLLPEPESSLTQKTLWLFI